MAMLPTLAKVMGPVSAGHPALQHAMMAVKSGHASNAMVATLMTHMPLSVRARVRPSWSRIPLLSRPAGLTVLR